MGIEVSRLTDFFHEIQKQAVPDDTFFSKLPQESVL